MRRCVKSAHSSSIIPNTAPCVHGRPWPGTPSPMPMPALVYMVSGGGQCAHGSNAKELSCKFTPRNQSVVLFGWAGSELPCMSTHTSYTDWHSFPAFLVLFKGSTFIPLSVLGAMISPTQPHHPGGFKAATILSSCPCSSNVALTLYCIVLPCLVLSCLYCLPCFSARRPTRRTVRASMPRATLFCSQGQARRLR